MLLTPHITDKAIDHGTVPGQVGPQQVWLEQRAGGGGLGDLLCLLVGAFGEANTDMDRLLRTLAESRALFLSREAGLPGPVPLDPLALGTIPHSIFSPRAVQGLTQSVINRPGPGSLHLSPGNPGWFTSFTQG